MGQGRRQTERITRRQAGSERQASKQSGEGVNSPGKTQEDKLGKTLGNVSQGKNKTSHWVSVCVLLLCEWVNEVQVWWGNQGWWVNGDSCVIGLMVDGNVCVQCMMGDVVHGWCAVEVSGNQIHDTTINTSTTFCCCHAPHVTRRWGEQVELKTKFNNSKQDTYTGWNTTWRLEDL